MNPQPFRFRVALGLCLSVGCTGAINGMSEPAGKPPSAPPNTPGTPPNQMPMQPVGPIGQPGAANPETPSHTPMRRLTKDEYNRTVRDLLGLDENFAGAFSADEEAGGFHANTISKVSEPEADQYHAAADKIASKAIAAGINKLAACAPATGLSDSCADEFVRKFGRRAFRRPLTADEVTRYKGLFAAGGNTSFADGAQLVITAMLQSPNFLYLPEVGDKAAAERDALPLDPFETAARLSYFLIGSMPDDDLAAAADAGKLRTVDEVVGQAKRLLASPRARESISSFYLQWLEAVDMGTVDKNATMFPGFTPAVRDAMKAELAAFGSRVTLDEDGKLASLLTAGYSYPGAALGSLYGVSGASGNKLDFPQGQRAGLFTLAGVMALYAHPDQSRPVGRGFLVSEKLLCATPPPPPNNDAVNVPPIDPNTTTRERLEKHRADPTCAACHAAFDGFGMTFEIYDAVGAYRTKDGSKPVDATAKGLPRGLPDVKDAVELMGALAKNDEVRDCMVKQWFRYSFARVETTQDNGTLAVARDAFARGDFSVRDLLVAIAGSRGFRYRALPQ